MKFSNISRVTEIHLLGFLGLHKLHNLFFLILLILYCVTICGNLLIILLVSYSKSLHSPMFFFLTQLSFSDILLTNTIVPNMLLVVLHEGLSVSFIGCLIQYYVFLGSEALECLLLAVMSYDRYQAICNPLHYNLVMDPRFCLRSVLLCWLAAVSVVFLVSIFMSYLYFCGPNTIDHFFCDFDPILELSCSDTLKFKQVTTFLIIPYVVCPFIFITVSYVNIIMAILKIPSVTGRQKTFSTCSSHLAVVSMFYLSIVSIYVFPSQTKIKKITSLLYTVITPLLNPIIYSLSNRNIIAALRKLFGASPVTL
ncbi:olfactory receptor 11L1-like [Engystomops pustulosus]|uniref:olfactory receptor 11L1-like n=1 Tax=Engystomops pustulosus TaxID=76066 RepID=UPI003AFA7571